ncbi:hypothetical protein DPMN_072101 [Dreissena polymorpha]|uniref:Uncharacterized protein n=1 Tax=Dreissena polymorpha TaxID=45954 RepID=A0A9D3Z7Q7_DREPO|nr:hypothetical protein DPMN_072101 [Dreissena polymorpha]
MMALECCKQRASSVSQSSRFIMAATLLACLKYPVQNRAALVCSFSSLSMLVLVCVMLHAPAGVESRSCSRLQRYNTYSTVCLKTNGTLSCFGANMHVGHA